MANLLAARDQEIEFTIRPERTGSKYTIAWTTLYFDRETQEWVPLYDRPDEDTDDG